MLGPLVESLHADLKDFFMSRIEEMARPLKAEASTIRLWLARVASHLDGVQPSSKDPSTTDLVDLFGPCSPVKFSSTLPFFIALAADYVPSGDSIPHNEKLASTTTDDVGQTAQSTSKDYELPIINKMTSEDSVGPRLHVQTPRVPSSAVDVALTPSVNKRLGETSHLTLGATPSVMVPSNCVQHMADPQDLPME